MAVTRYYEAIIYIECCKDGEEMYTPQPIIDRGHKTKPRWNNTLVEWGDEMHEWLDDKWREKADAQCRMVGTRRLCRFDIRVDRWETGSPDCPKELRNSYDEYIRKIQHWKDRIEDNNRFVRLFEDDARRVENGKPIDMADGSRRVLPREHADLFWKTARDTEDSNRKLEEWLYKDEERLDEFCRDYPECC